MHSQIIRKQNGGTKEDHSWVHFNIMDHTYQPQVYGAGQKMIWQKICLIERHQFLRMYNRYPVQCSSQHWIVAMAGINSAITVTAHVKSPSRRPNPCLFTRSFGARSFSSQSILTQVEHMEMSIPASAEGHARYTYPFQSNRLPNTNMVKFLLCPFLCRVRRAHQKNGTFGTRFDDFMAPHFYLTSLQDESLSSFIGILGEFDWDRQHGFCVCISIGTKIK